MRNRLTAKQTDLLITGSLVIACLLPVWLFSYFLTGDGPCHIYNASVTWDFLTGKATELQQSYYMLSTHIDPNWFSHIVLGILLQLFDAGLAEKIFLSLYMTGFVFGLRALLRAMHTNNIFLLPLASLFLFHHVFQMGFYNFSFSIVFFFFITAYWIKHHDHFTAGKTVFLAFLLVLEYFTHPVGLSLSLLVMLLFSVLHLYTSEKKRREQNRLFFRKLIQLVIVSAVPVMLMFLFMLRRGTQQTPSASHLYDLLYAFFELTALTTLVHEENSIGNWTAIAVLVLVVTCILVRIMSKKAVTGADAFLYSAVILFILYVNQPENIGGVGVVPQRLQFIPYLLFTIWAFAGTYKSQFKMIMGAVGYFLLAAFLVVRIPVYREASGAVQEYLSVAEYIDDHSVVMPLSFSHNGKTTDGSLIADRIYLFTHAADYMGAEKDLILLGNYEANTGWFPLIWHDDKNPFWHLSRNEGFEFQPPCIDLNNFESHAGDKIDYIITWCLDGQYATHPYTLDLMRLLDEQFSLIYTSEYSRAKLYRRIK